MTFENAFTHTKKVLSDLNPESKAKMVEVENAILNEPKKEEEKPKVEEVKVPVVTEEK